MGGVSCCTAENSDKASALTALGKDLKQDEATPVCDEPGAVATPAAAAGGDAKECEQLSFDDSYMVTLDKADGSRLGLDVDVTGSSGALPVLAITGGLAEQWNNANPSASLRKGDCIIQVNGIQGSVGAMLECCQNHSKLVLKVQKALSYQTLVVDLRKLINTKGCGPILIRLSWHDAGVYSTGARSGGCPNAALRFTDAGEGTFGANAGLPDVALGLLAPIAEKYVPHLLSHADLWALAANAAIGCMGGPEIPTRFGRVDARSSLESVPSQEGRLPDGDKGSDHLREIFHPKGLDDKAIVALSGAHTVGRCHPERSGFEGPWTTDPMKFDNSYFTELVRKTYQPETSAKGKPQHRCPASKTMMLISDLALLADPALKTHVDRYAASQDEWFRDFSEAWIQLQEAGCHNLQNREAWFAAREA